MRRAVVALALALIACAGRSTRAGGTEGAHVREREARIDDTFTEPPDVLVAIRPAKLARDPLYGPLLRRVSQLASARATFGASVGSTALAALERADEVLVGVYDPDARDAVVAVRGVPPDVDASRVVDTDGHALWTHARDLRGDVEELAPATATTDPVALFVLPRRAWVVAVGPAVARVRAALVEGAHASGATLGSLDPDALAVARIRGDVVVRVSPRIVDGPLAPLATKLDAIVATVQPGPEGQIGEVVARFLYADEPTASAAERCAIDVLGAFTRRFEAKDPWLHAVKITREDRTLVARGRIPRAWAEGFAHPEAELGAAP